ncbi:MAG TPA: sigma-70 family RNA polymerase sigma factor [Acidimicrobiales bacterium]|nr:sigma-70 family RNA polymerase sigma factor [Acidimicrobiales bacterium]
MDDERRQREERFRRLYVAHYGAIDAYCARRTDEASDAVDAVAETFSIAWRRLAEVPDAEFVLPWLYGVARRVLANQRRGNRRRGELSTRLRGQQSIGPDVDEDLLAQEDRRTVLEALARLKDSDREVLRLAAWEELSHREIAQVMACSEGSVAVRLHRARLRLGKEIAKGGAPTGHERRTDRGWRTEGQES